MGNVIEDINSAKDIIDNGCSEESLPFSSISPLYTFTNESMSDHTYRDTLKDKETVLSIIGSGDQILNSILLGSEDITGIDISKFALYYLKLKMAAVKSLSYDEFLAFFCPDSKKCLNMKLFDRVANNLDKDYLTFWNELLSKYGTMKVRDSELFRFSLENKRTIASNNPYLESHHSYRTLRSKIGDINLNLENCDIFSLPSKLNKNYSLINISNIIDYITVEQYLNFTSRLPLAENGTILSYSFSPSTNFLFANRWCNDRFTSEVIPVARKIREEIILTKHKNN